MTCGTCGKPMNGPLPLYCESCRQNHCRRCHRPMSGGTCVSCDSKPYAEQWWKHQGHDRSAPKSDSGQSA